MIACVIAGGIGCSTDRVDEVAPDPGTGTLLQSWTIEGTTDAAKCAFFGATQIRIVLSHALGTVYATRIADCDEFRTSQVVRVQPYTAFATFYNSAGEPVSRNVSLGNITPIENTTVVNPTIDFTAADLTPPIN